MTVTRVLLVEDEPGYARFLREILLEISEVQHEITLANTLEAATRSLRTESASFDIVLLDLGLPDADGTEALAQIVSCAPTLPIVILSAREDLGFAIESMRLGAQEYLVKGQAEHVILPRAMRYAIERKRLRDAAIAAREEAVRANAVKDNFLAMLGHELRNPLAPIVTAIALIEQRDVKGIERELAVVRRQVQQVVRLVDDLLDVARIARGKVELQRENVDIAEAVTAAVESAKPLLEERRHTIHLDVPPGELHVHGDLARLTQVVTNLLTNAAKYTPAGGNVWITARADDASIELRVRDDGIGMEAPLLSRVFGLFEQGSMSFDRASGGLGLGLAIVQNIATLHGGTATAASEGLGKGSELIVRLPRSPGTTTASQLEAAAPAANTRTSSVENEPRRILIVDDNQDNAELLDQILTHLGHTTCVAYDGSSAIQLALQFAPDLAPLDIGLPVIDGYEVARQMNAQMGAQTPMLVAITGYGQSSDRERSRESGFHSHLVKPVQLDKLREVIAATPKKR
jgi:signal transduction histidine kinase